MGHNSHCTQYTNAGMLYWLNVDNWKLLSHNINCAVSLIPGLNKYFSTFYLYPYISQEVRMLELQLGLVVILIY